MTARRRPPSRLLTFARLAGIGFRSGGSVPYVQVKYLTGYEYLVVAAGIRF